MSIGKTDVQLLESVDSDFHTPVSSFSQIETPKPQKAFAPEKKSKMATHNDIEDDTLNENDPLLDDRESESSSLPFDPSVFAWFGDLMWFSVLGFTVFTVFLLLKLVKILDWSYWFVCLALAAILCVWLLITQSKKLTKKVPLILRLAWVFAVVSLATFLLFVIFKLQKTITGEFATWFSAFLPLWVLLGIAGLLGAAAICVCCFSRDDGRKKKYCFTGTPLCCLVIIIIPFLLMLQYKLDHPETGIEWSYMFIPLWITDFFLFVAGVILIVFTFGGSEDSVFNIPQLICFQITLLFSTVFKILLVIRLEDDNIDLYIVFAPLFVMELILFGCGINFRFVHAQRANEAKSEVNFGSHSNELQEHV